MSKKFLSKYSGTLEVTVRNGRKVLDSENATYSYGTAANLWKNVLRRLDLSGVQSILVLGLGGGSILRTLESDFGFDGVITAVELDPVIVKIARQEFGIRESAKLTIECMDAYDYVIGRRKKFDLVIVDISIDFSLPEKMLTPEFWKGVIGRTSDSGIIAFNGLAYRKELNPVSTQLSEAGFDVTLYKRINKVNNVLVGHRIPD